MSLFIPPAALARAPIIAVFDVQVSGVDSLRPGTADRLASFVAGRLATSGSFEVIPRSQVKTRLLEAKSETYRDCYDQACQIELGREMAAEKSVALEVLRLGRSCTVNLTLYDLARATTDAAESGDGACDEEGIVQTLKGVVARLVEKWNASAMSIPAPATAGALPAGRGAGEPDSAAATLGIPEAQWRAMKRQLGERRSLDLAQKYLEASRKGEYSPSSGRSFNDFLDVTRAGWEQKRDRGKWTTVAGLLLIGTGMIMGAASYATGDGDVDVGVFLGGFAGFLPAGGIIALVGGPIWGINQSRMNALDRSRTLSLLGSGPIRFGGVGPLLDGSRRARGALLSFRF